MAHAALDPTPVYLNGRILPRDQARIDPFDRAFLFGDALYEGLRAFGSRVLALDLHASRLREGLAAASIDWDAGELPSICDTLLAATGLRDAFLYVQVSRGTPAPDQPLRARVPPPSIQPTVFAYAVPTPPLTAYPPVPTKRCVTLPDPRWLLGHVKSTSLMGGVFTALASHHAGADDALLLRDTPRGPLVAESTSANVILALPAPAGGVELVTPALASVPILAGVTRALLLDAARRDGLPITERDVHAEELAQAREVMLCGTLTMVTVVTHLDGRAVGNGAPGPLATRLLNLLCARIASPVAPPALAR